MILVQYQKKAEGNDGSKVTLTPDYEFVRNDHRSYKAKDVTFEPYVGGKRADAIRLERVEMEDRKEFDKSTLKNEAWVRCRRNNESEVFPSVPAWSCSQKFTVVDAKVPGSPTNMDVVLEMMVRCMKCMRELELPYIFLV